MFAQANAVVWSNSTDRRVAPDPGQPVHFLVEAIPPERVLVSVVLEELFVAGEGRRARYGGAALEYELVFHECLERVDRPPDARCRRVRPRVAARTSPRR